jgi:hypothetical protein
MTMAVPEFFPAAGVVLAGLEN